jgi:hypothetical protein
MPYRNGVQRAAVEKKVAFLSSDWGLQVATEKFGAELISQMPTYTRGPRKGKPKGALTWTKCTEGGWQRSQGGQGGVTRPGTYDWALTLTPYQTHDHGRVAEWTWLAKTDGDNPRYG